MTLAPETALRRPPADPSRISLEYRHEHTLDAQWDESTLEVWEVEAHINLGYQPQDAPDPELLVVGRMSFVRVKMHGPGNPWEAMDAYSGDLASVGETVLDVGSGEWSPAFDKFLEYPVGDLLVMDRVVLQPQWRGLALGPILAASVISRLSAGCAAVACEPAPADQRELTIAEDERAREKLAALWARIGFRPFRNGIHVLNCALQRPLDLQQARREEFAAYCRAYASPPAGT
ncbi:hypothetical protein [Streptomyces xiamenensis]|uniref:hypothetical protein n=1 Tax=Streptomyces xiamenensis TaxID=408015 RepID=UPI0035DB9CD7